MDRNTLTTLMRARGLSQSELARGVGVSRQAVSLWLKQGPIVQVRGVHLIAVARLLRKRPEQLVEPLPLREANQRAALSAKLLWDRLYPSIDDFAIALTQREPRALARLVEVYGLYAAAKIAGAAAVWRGFPDYARFIPPVRRHQLEDLWSWKSSRAQN